MFELGGRIGDTGNQFQRMGQDAARSVNSASQQVRELRNNLRDAASAGSQLNRDMGRAGPAAQRVVGRTTGGARGGGSGGGAAAATKTLCSRPGTRTANGGGAVRIA